MEVLTAYVEQILSNAQQVVDFLSNFGIDILTYANKYLQILMHSAESLIKFISHIPDAMSLVVEYTTALPIYLHAPIFIFISLSAIYFILGR